MDCEQLDPTTPHSPGWRYRGVIALLTPVIAGFSAYRAHRTGQRRYFVERLGCGADLDADAPVWIHAASVGEVNAVHALVAGLQRTRPTLPILVTTVTTTGAEAVARLGSAIHHRYLPWDSRSAVRRFLSRCRPRCAVIMETELWPNLYRECRRRGIAPLIINGRLSDKTLNAGGWLRRAYTATLRNCAAILTRSEADTERFRRLGAQPDRVRCLGNIKHASGHMDSSEKRRAGLPRPYLLLASTHEDEEVRIARAWMRHPDTRYLLVIAPRHPQRTTKILKQLQTVTERIAVRSRRQEITADTAIYLADTLGEMPWLMHHAELVFMGGSLIPRGGHNVLEPAQLGKAILVGPHTENFTAERALLESAGAVCGVADENDLVGAFKRLLDDTEARRRLEQNAQAAVAAHENVAQAYLEAVLAHCGCG